MVIGATEEFAEFSQLLALNAEEILNRATLVRGAGMLVEDGFASTGAETALNT